MGNEWQMSLCTQRSVVGTRAFGEACVPPGRAWSQRGGPVPRQFSPDACPLSGTRDAALGAFLGREPRPLTVLFLQVTGIPMNCSVKLQLSLYVKAIKGIG